MGFFHTARKLAGLYYRTIMKGNNYVEQGIEKYEQKIQETQLKMLINHISISEHPHSKGITS